MLKRVLIIGGAATGKSYTAKKISELTKLPVFEEVTPLDLDQFDLSPGIFISNTISVDSIIGDKVQFDLVIITGPAIDNLRTDTKT